MTHQPFRVDRMSPRKNLDHLEHGLADALGVMGEWWTPLVIWNIDQGSHRFEQLQASLGIARNILTNRLKTLVEYKIVEKREYSSKPRRYEYHLTARGEALIPILAELEKWGSKMVKK